MTNEDSRPTAERAGILRSVATPLNFFALVVLAAEGVVGATSVAGHLSEPHLFVVLLSMIAILALLVVVVGLLTWFLPRHLSPEMAQALEKSEQAYSVAVEVRKFLNKKAFMDRVLDTVSAELPQLVEAEIVRQTGGPDSEQDPSQHGRRHPQ